LRAEWLAQRFRWIAAVNAPSAIDSMRNPSGPAWLPVRSRSRSRPSSLTPLSPSRR
jgi:hypothetical protein